MDRMDRLERLEEEIKKMEKNPPAVKETKSVTKEVRPCLLPAREGGRMPVIHVPRITLAATRDWIFLP